LTTAVLSLALAVPVLAVATTLMRPTPAQAANVVNVTINIPAATFENTCGPVPDTVAVSGQLHIVIETTPNGQGGFQAGNYMNMEAKGTGLVSGDGYVVSKTDETKEHTWNALPPFPASTHFTSDYELVSQSGTDNFLMHVTLYEKIDASGNPTVVVENVWFGCRG
jgi:hypothetical protein